MTSSLIAEWASAAAPPPKLTVSEWADRTRLLPETSGARGARWRTDAVPYLRGIMDAVHEPGVTKIAVMKCHQVGGPLALDTPVPTPDGWTTVGAIKAGDVVFTELGVPTRVVGTSEVFTGRQCYRLTFSDGSELVADAEHRWQVDSRLVIAHGHPGLRLRGGKPRRGVPRAYSGVLTTAEIVGSIDTVRKPLNRYSIRTAGALTLPEADLPVHPYVLGVWLGDGHSYSAQVSQDAKDAPELIEHLRTRGLSPFTVREGRAGTALTIALERAAHSGNSSICRRGHDMDVVGRVKGRVSCAECHRQHSQKSQRGYPVDPVVRRTLAGTLAAMGLLRNSIRSTNSKHIPAAYLRASEQQRLELLRGLMDTDGHCSTRGRCQFVTVSDRLKNDVVDLLCGLGYKPFVAKKPVRSKGEYVCRGYWRVEFTAYSDRPVFALTRKRLRLPNRETGRPREVERRYITAVEPVASVPVRCLSVESDGHLFLVGRTMIATHNSEALHNVVGYFIEYDACPMLFVHPTAAVAEEWSKERLADMIRSTPALAAVVREKRTPRGQGGEDGSTLQLKMFPGGFLALGGANTPNTFARRSVRVAIGDDVDRFPAVVGEEGDPADLLHNRTTSFYDGFSFLVSTPTIKGGRIDALFQRSDQRRFFLTCPACGREDFIVWNDAAHFRVGFDDRRPETARLECAAEEHGGCGVHLFEPERRLMIAEAGRRADHGWRATTTAKDRGVVGFHLPAMVSTLGSVTLETLVEKWLSARERGKESLRVFVNTALAEGWEELGTRMNPHALLHRREDYGDGIEVPGPAVVLTAGVDVQADRFELTVQGWAAAGERWLVDHRVIPGDPKRPETRAALLEALSRRYRHASGHDLPISATCVDTGYATEEIYDFVLAYQVRRIFATKGFAGKSGEPIVGKASERRYGKNPRPVRLYPINVDDAKSDVLNGLTLPSPGPGYLHFPLHLDVVHEEYFAQICAEHRETRYNKSGVATHFVWVLDRERNEALDCAVLALAAFRLLNPNVRQMAETLAAIPVAPSPESQGTAGTPPASPPKPRAERRVGRSKYLGS